LCILLNKIISIQIHPSLSFSPQYYFENIIDTAERKRNLIYTVNKVYYTLLTRFSAYYAVMHYSLRSNRTDKWAPPPPRASGELCDKLLKDVTIYAVWKREMTNEMINQSQKYTREIRVLSLFNTTLKHN